MRTVTFDENEWQLVPKDGTAKMLDALRTGSRKDWPSDELCRVRLAAMLAAAPDHPATAGDAEDAARLEWVLRHTPGDALRYSVGVLADTADLSEFRAAIDSKRASKGGE